jgi:uncharacterized protein YdeI (YjbR/CyaY-like superfamily)
MTGTQEEYQGQPVRGFATTAEFEDWLVEQGDADEGLWVKLSKKGAPTATIGYAEVLESALCFGWIDGQKRPLDEHYWLQRFTPRRPRSKWSKINRDRVTALTEAGRMRPAGLREVELAKADGRWEAAYASQRTVDVPEELQAALDADPEAAAFFAELDSANRYAVLYRVHEAKRAATRTARIEKFVAMLHAHETIHPQRAKRSAD